MSGVEAAFEAEDISMYGEEERYIRGISASVLRGRGGVFLSFVCREQLHLNLPKTLSDIVGGMGEFSVRIMCFLLKESGKRKQSNSKRVLC